MSKLVRICGTDELPAKGLAKEFTAGGKTLCVANIEGAIHALGNVCPHRGGPLSEGLIEDGMVVCPWHAWAFDPQTGRASHDQKEKISVYAVTISANDVQVDIE